MNGDGVKPMAEKGKTKAVAYLRTSSASNVGGDKDSDKRQRAAIAAFARAQGYEMVDEFYDAAVSGADPIETQPGFAALLDRIEGNGVRTVLVEDASRFARDLMTQELGVMLLIKRGVRVLASNGVRSLDRSNPPQRLLYRGLGAAAAYPTELEVPLRCGSPDQLHTTISTDQW
jgi:DNA invertase Pin-like site-specific DNA recombinase